MQDDIKDAKDFRIQRIPYTDDHRLNLFTEIADKPTHVFCYKWKVRRHFKVNMKSAYPVTAGVFYSQ